MALSQTIDAILYAFDAAIIVLVVLGLILLIQLYRLYKRLDPAMKAQIPAFAMLVAGDPLPLPIMLIKQALLFEPFTSRYDKSFNNMYNYGLISKKPPLATLVNQIRLIQRIYLIVLLTATIVIILVPLTLVLSAAK